MRLSDEIFHAEMCICLWVKLFDILLIDILKNIKMSTVPLIMRVLFGFDNGNNVCNPIIEYLIDDANVDYTTPE